MIAQRGVQTQMLLSLHFTSLLAGSPVASHQSLGCCDRHGFDGRKYEELSQPLLFAKYLPLHSHLEENRQFSEILEQVNESPQELYKWQESFSWEEIVGSNDKTIGLSFFPLFRVSACEVCCCRRILLNLQAVLNRFKVKLSFLTEDALRVEFHYDANLFLDIKRLAGQFQTLLQKCPHQTRSINW